MIINQLLSFQINKYMKISITGGNFNQNGGKLSHIVAKIWSQII